MSFNLQQTISDLKCCIVNAVWKGAKDDLLGKECDHSEIILLNKKYKIIKGYVVVGTILYYDLAVCASIPMTGFLPLLADGLTITLVINTSAGDITIVSFTGDFAGFTLSQFIDAIVDEIADSGNPDYTATNQNPNLRVCFNGQSSINLIGSTVTVQLQDRWILKWTESNARRGASTTLGYGSISALKPSYVAGATPKLFVPNGDGIATIPTTQDFDGVATGTAGRVATLTAGLSTTVFTNGEPIYFTKTVAGTPTYLYTINATITAYNAGTGVITFTVGLITRQDLTNSPFPTVTINPMTALGLGVTSWTFNDAGHGWGTVSVYTCDLVTGNLTYVAPDTQIPVRMGGGGGMSIYSASLGYVYVVGYGQSLSHGSIVKINTTTNAVAASRDFGLTGTTYMFENPVNHTIYVSCPSAPILLKTDGNLNYDNTKNLSINVGSMTSQADGIVYTAPYQTNRLIVRKGADVGTAWNVIEPPQNPLFTPLDFTVSAPAPLNANFNGALATDGLLNQIINIGVGLDGLNTTTIPPTNLVWITGALFTLTRLDTVSVPNRLYVINGQVNSYDNATGVLDFDINTVVYWHTPAQIGIGTMVSASGAINFSPVFGLWTWFLYPNVKGAIEMYYHEDTQTMFITRYTSAGGLLQSWDISSGVEATILATQTNHYPPNFPATILSGTMNYQSAVGKMFLPTSNGQLAYVFDPITKTFDPSPITHPALGAGHDVTTGGIQSFSLTGDATDPLNPNLYATTPNGTEIGVVSFLEGSTSQFIGTFDGTAEEVVQTEEMNCQTLTQIEDAAEDIKLKLNCGCGDCHDVATDLPDNSEPVITGNVYYGRSANTGLTEAEILALTSVSQTGFAGTYDYVALPSTYIYLAFPTSFGTPTTFHDNIGGFDVVMNTPTSVLVNSVLYTLYRSYYQIGGAQSMTVS